MPGDEKQAMAQMLILIGGQRFNGFPAAAPAFFRSGCFAEQAAERQDGCKGIRIRRVFSTEGMIAFKKLFNKIIQLLKQRRRLVVRRTIDGLGRRLSDVYARFPHDCR